MSSDELGEALGHPPLESPEHAAFPGTMPGDMGQLPVSFTTLATCRSARHTPSTSVDPPARVNSWSVLSVSKAVMKLTLIGLVAAAAVVLPSAPSQAAPVMCQGREATIVGPTAPPYNDGRHRG